jgi:hypothetical protein
LELEGNLVLEHPPMRRWVAFVAVVIPVMICVGAVAWFIRAFVAPPSVAIGNGPQLASAPPAPAPPQAIETPPPRPASEPATQSPPAAAPEQPVEAAAAPSARSEPAIPMISSLAAAPPTIPDTPMSLPDTATAPAAVAENSSAGDEANKMENASPVAGPIPLPRTRPHLSAAFVAGAVPLPRPRPAPAESVPETPDLPAFDRHAPD